MNARPLFDPPIGPTPPTLAYRLPERIFACITSRRHHLNFWVLSVACITLVAFLAHVLIGTRETATIVPPSSDDKLTTSWVQAMCAFQMLSVDLLAVAAPSPFSTLVPSNVLPCCC